MIHPKTSLHIAPTDLLALVSKAEGRVLSFGIKSPSATPLTNQNYVYFCLQKCADKSISLSAVKNVSATIGAETGGRGECVPFKIFIHHDSNYSPAN